MYVKELYIQVVYYMQGVTIIVMIIIEDGFYRLTQHSNSSCLS